MALDPSIALGFRQPEAPNQLNMLAQALQVQGLQRQNQMGAMQMREAEAAAAERNALKNYLAGGANLDTPEGEAGLYRVAPTQAPGILRGRLDLTQTKTNLKKTEAETAAAQFKLRQDQVNQNLQRLSAISTPEQAAQWMQGGVQSGLITPEQAQAELQRVPRDPQGFAQWKQEQQMAGLSLSQQMEQQWKAKDFGLNVQKFEETKRSNKVQEGISAGNLKVSQGRLELDKTAPKGVLDPERGLLVDPRTGEARPITLGGQPVGQKPDAATKKELTSLNQQDAVIQGAIDAVKKTPSAFNTTRGIATMAGSVPESVAGKFDTKEEREARAYVFNNVSSVINERAGAAQSAQELARLRSFLPAETDNANQIIDKFEAYQKYIADKRAGTTSAKPAAAKSGPAVGVVEGGYRFKGGDPADKNNWEKQ